MAFTPFVDDLALVEVLLVLVGAVLAYSGVRVWWAARSGRPDEVRRVLRGTAIPIGIVGATTLVIALWGEMTWPFLTSDGMGGYNIFFFDPMLLCGFVLLAFAVSALLSAKMQYVGVFAMVAGAATIFYGWSGYTANPQFTKEPFDTLLLYSGFGLAGLMALPSSAAVDYYLAKAEAGASAWAVSDSITFTSPARWGSRAVQPLVPPGNKTEDAPTVPAVVTRMPRVLQVLVLVFPVAMALAGIAALWFFGTTLPGHLGNGPGAAP